MHIGYLLLPEEHTNTHTLSLFLSLSLSLHIYIYIHVINKCMRIHLPKKRGSGIGGELVGIALNRCTCILKRQSTAALTIESHSTKEF